MSFINTPRANQVHIGLFGKRNSGKSSLINALTNQEIAAVSSVAGTTTDPVYKTMEIQGIGPCVFIDTAGFDDKGDLGVIRVRQTVKAIEKTDIALMVCCDERMEEEMHWIKLLKEKNIPVIIILNKADLLENERATALAVGKLCGLDPVVVSAKEKRGMNQIRQAIAEQMPVAGEEDSIVGTLAQTGDVVLLVMPQDVQAPKGRLILPQVQTIRDLLDKKCIVMSCTTDKIEDTLKVLIRPPQLIITDSQVFRTVYEKKPAESKLTSFSVLFAKYKGDINYYVEGAAVIDRLGENSKILIAEACTHAPLTEDIGREKLPRMLRRRAGEGLQVDVVSGADFPEDLSGYDLIIQCGACMFNRKYVLNRIEKAKRQKVPMTNYGVAIAYLSGILEQVAY